MLCRVNGILSLSQLQSNTHTNTHTRTPCPSPLPPPPFLPTFLHRQGSLQGGHYETTLRVGEGWVVCNDDLVTACDPPNSTPSTSQVKKRTHYVDYVTVVH